MKKLLVLFLGVSTLAFAAGKLQDADFKTELDLIAAGGNASLLLNDTKIYVTSVAKTLDDAIADGDIAGAPTTTKGDISGHNGTEPTRIPVGNDGEFIIADSSQSLGVRWSDQLQGTLNPVSDWESFTPTGTFTTNVTYVGKKRRVGDTLEIEGTIFFSGAPNTATLDIDIPDGLAIDTSKISTSLINEGNFGSSWVQMSNRYGAGPITFSTTTSVRLFTMIGSSDANHMTAISDVKPRAAGWVNNDEVHFKFAVPIAGWSSGTDAVVKNRKLLKVRANNVAGATSTTSFTYNYVNSVNELEDNLNALTDTGDVIFTAPHDGVFDFHFGARIDMGAPTNYIECGITFVSSIQNSLALLNDYSNGNTNQYAKCLFTGVRLEQGDTAKFYTRKAGTASITWVNDNRYSFINIDERADNFVIAGTFGKCQTKYLSADVTTDTIDIADLRFNNLVIGQRYNVRIRPLFDFANASNDNALVSVVNNSNQVCAGTTAGFNGMQASAFDDCDFVAGATTLTSDLLSLTAGNALRGAGIPSETKITLCTDNREETTEWN